LFLECVADTSAVPSLTLSLTIALKYVLSLFMSTASATAALPDNPDPPQDSAVTPDPPSATAAERAARPSRGGRMLSLLRKLIDYGQDLVRSVQQRAAAGTLVSIALHFGTLDAAVILARIARGLSLANALEARLIIRPVRLDARPAPAGPTPAGPTPAGPTPAGPTPAGPTPVPAPPEGVPRAVRRAVKRPALPDVPTAEEIAAALRHRPAAAVIADICRDLGIVPAHPLWGEVMAVLSEHGGGFVKYFKNVMDRMCLWLTARAAVYAEARPAPRPQPAAACGTGPP
jgi:hypothetical protein